MPPLEYPGSPAGSLRTAQTWVEQNLDSPGVICPCCNQVAARRHRHLHHSMAAALLILVRYFRENLDVRWVHAERYFKTMPTVPAELRGDFPKLTHWGLLEARPPDEQTERAYTGEYRVTRTGFRFADCTCRVHRSGWMFNKEMLIDTDSPLINIHDALGDRFNYAELLGRDHP